MHIKYEWREPDRYRFRIWCLRDLPLGSAAERQAPQNRSTDAKQLGMSCAPSAALELCTAAVVRQAVAAGEIEEMN